MAATAPLPPATPAGVARPRRAVQRVGQLLVTVLLVLMALIAVSTAFADDPFPQPAIVLIASFGALATAWGLVITWTAPRSRASSTSLWVLPLFFVWHVAALGTWVPDAGFALAALVGVLLINAPGAFFTAGCLSVC